MNATEQKTAAKKFAEYWKDRGYEKGESQKFWIDLLEHVYGVEDITEFITFEDQVRLDHTSFIDGFIPSTHVLIEQKGLGKDLRKGIKQSDGSVLSPFQQAKRYAAELPYSQRPRWIVTCNFAEFLVYDMEKPNGEPEQILLKDLPKEYYRLQFLVNTGNEHIKKEMEVSLQAGELVGKLYNSILKQYKHPDSPESLKSLNMLCVRLVFCLYAEDAGIFGKHGMFHDYLRQFDVKNARKALIELFKILDTTEDKRDPYDETMLSEFPYVNGGLFRDEDIEIPNFTDEIMEVLLEDASAGFNWADISPTIFGAVFESTLNPETRRSGGMHYTSIENIHKVIDPLFLDELRAEFVTIKEAKQANVRKTKLEEFQKKLASLKFLDPACGSGNFLTETYISLRRLENEILFELNQGQMMFGDGEFSPIQVSIGQFYGIEINDFAVTVAKTALWIAESQMMKATEEIVQMSLDFLPLKSYANIVEGNALRVDWESVVPKAELNYIMGNPPFVANSGRVSAKESSVKAMMSVDQKEEKQALFGKSGGVLDYVACWYKKAAIYMKNTNVKAAFVSTNSICQGEQVAPLWKPLCQDGIYINFAHRSFKWKSEASKKATVFVVIVGFSYNKTESNYLYDNESLKIVKHINAYLVEAEDVFIEKRNKPLCDAATMHRDSQPTDDGNFIFTETEYLDFIKQYPTAVHMFRKFMMGKDFIDRKPRYCLWLVDTSPSELKKYPPILKRISAIREFRSNSTKEATRKKADTPTLFDENQQPNTNYVAIPEVSSGGRRYVPIDFMTPEIVVGNKIRILENAGLYEFGVLTSNVHMAWMRATCGYYGPSYQYSINIVYNNFPWCDPTPEQKAKIEKTAQAILDAREKYPDCSLADLYDELTMPPELRKAHHENDFAVMAAYGFDKKITESECVAELMGMYREMTEKK